MSAHRADLEYIEVGESVEVALATVAARATARVIDHVVAGVPAWLAAALVFGDAVVPAVLMILAVSLVYEATLTAARGSTPGKSLMRIEVLRVATGTPPGLGDAFLRSLMHWTVPFNTLSILLIEERTRRGWNDLAAGTVVVSRPAES